MEQNQLSCKDNTKSIENVLYRGYENNISRQLADNIEEDKLVNDKYEIYTREQY